MQSPFVAPYSSNVIIGFLSQLSVATASFASITGTLSHSTVNVPPLGKLPNPGTETVGAFVSFTVITCDAVPIFPHSSEADQVRIIWYSHAFLSPTIFSSSVTFTTFEQTSFPVGFAGAGAVSAQSIVVFAGTPVNVGADLSRIVIIC